MIITCRTCAARFDDEFRSTICPHNTFAANDGENNFAHHPESYLSPPMKPFAFRAHHLSRRLQKKKLKRDLAAPFVVVDDSLRHSLTWCLAKITQYSRRGSQKKEVSERP